MPTLADSYNVAEPSQCQLSESASPVLLSTLSRRCYHHAELACCHKDSARTAKDFWTRHFSLQTLIEDRKKLLAPNLTVQAGKAHSVSFTSYVFLCGIDIYLQEAALVKVDPEGEEPATITAAEIKQRSRSAAHQLVGTAWATSGLPPDEQTVRTNSNAFQPVLEDSPRQKRYFAVLGPFMARPVAAAIRVLGRDLQECQDEAAASTVVGFIQPLLRALDRLEVQTGIWHESVAKVVTAVREWDEAHGDRSTDTWAQGLFPQG